MTVGGADGPTVITALTLCEDNGVTVIAGGCPLMLMDFPYKCVRWLLGKMGKLPG